MLMLLLFLASKALYPLSLTQRDQTDPLVDPLRKEPRYRVVMRVLNFPD